MNSPYYFLSSHQLMDISFSIFVLEADSTQMTVTSKRYLVVYVNSFFLALGNLI